MNRFITKVIALVLMTSTAGAAIKETTREVKFKEFPIEIARGERLIVQGVRGHVRLIPSTNGKSALRARKTLPDATKPGAKSRFDDLAFTVRRESGVVIVEPKGPTTREDWIAWSGAGQPELSIEIETPSVAAEVHLHTGSVTAAGWKDQLSVSLQEGKINSSDGEGAFRASVLRGEIKIDKQKGPVEIETHAAKVLISNSEGAVRVNNFSGETSVTDVKGDVSFRAKTGGATISKVDGLDFDNGRGRLDASKIEGAVRGLNDDGNVSLQLVGEADVSIETIDGPVGVKPADGAGVLLKLSSEDGSIYAPDSVSVPKVSGPKSVVARLSGAPKGVIVLRAKHGTIRVR